MTKERIVSFLFLGIFIFCSSFLISESIRYQKDFERFIKVKGLAEKKVKSDKGIWTIQYMETGGSLAEIYSKISNNKIIIKKFFKKIGIEEKEIEFQNVTLNDNFSYGSKVHEGAQRYRATSGVSVYSLKVDFIKKFSQETHELIKKGVTLTGNRVKFLFEDLNSVKQGMLTLAMKNARLAAESFLKGSRTKVKNVRNISQGLFSVNDFSTGSRHYYSSSSLYKKVRVVVGVSYFIE
jgi:hypothetical protein